MATSSSSNITPKKQRLHLIDLWMTLSSVGLMIGYLIIRNRLASYAFILRWLRDAALYLTGHAPQ